MTTRIAQSDQDLVDLLAAWYGDAEQTLGDTERASSSARLPLPAWYGDEASEVPGAYPFTRGVTSRGYLDRLWVMGQYSGYSSPAETNVRFKELLSAGQTGLAVALDLPTQMGLDSDDPRSAGEVGRVGLPISTVDDLLAVLDGLPFEQIRQIRTSANAIGPIFTAFFSVAIEEMGVDPKTFRLMLQNDPLKEFSARGTFIFPPGPSVKLAVDVIEHFAQKFPRWEPIEFCGYHVRDAGGTAVQEVAVATANGTAYLDAAKQRGLDLRSIAHTFFLFLSSGVDIFEEAAKVRAARRLWARLLHERYGVPRAEAGVNTFVYTLGSALVAQEPLNNVIRVAYEALGAVLGGVQTMATSSFDEALGLPTKAAARLALRTQQILAHESGAANVVDPLGGSYYVEDLTDRLFDEIVAYTLTIAKQGGAVAVLENGFITKELTDAAYRLQQEIESGSRPVVGVNVHRSSTEGSTEVFQPPVEDQIRQIERLEKIRRVRIQREVSRHLSLLASTAERGENVIPSIVAAARARATLGEIVDVLKEIYGEHAQSTWVFE